MPVIFIIALLTIGLTVMVQDVALPLQNGNAVAPLTEDNGLTPSDKAQSTVAGDLPLILQGLSLGKFFLLLLSFELFI